MIKHLILHGVVWVFAVIVMMVFAPGETSALGHVSGDAEVEETAASVADAERSEGGLCVCAAAPPPRPKLSRRDTTRNLAWGFLAGVDREFAEK